MTSRLKIAVTLGDPAGIGPEVTAKALSDLDHNDIVIYGNAAVWQRGCELARFASPFPFVATDDLPLSSLSFGAATRESGRSAFQALARATDDLVAGRVDGLCTAPLAKSAVQLEKPDFIGHTEYLQQRFGLKRVVMLMAAEKLRVALVTTHVALADVPKRLTREEIVDTILLTAQELHTRFGIPAPRLAVCGLNPHAGEHGAFGHEEEDVITPALSLVRARGIDVSGPFAADGNLPRAVEQGFDAVVAMYHDQGLIPFKMVAFHDGVNVTLGLPRPRTSPDHGTAYDIAGKGVADARSMKSALALCVKLAQVP